MEYRSIFIDNHNQTESKNKTTESIGTIMYTYQLCKHAKKTIIIRTILKVIGVGLMIPTPMTLRYINIGSHLGPMKPTEHLQVKEPGFYTLK